MKIKFPFKYVVATTLLVTTTISCSSEVDNNLTKSHSEKLNKLISAHHFDNSKAFSALSFEAQSDFLNSFQYNESGEVITFHLDQEANNLTDKQFSELICLAVKSDVIQLIDEATTKNVRFNTGQTTINPGTGNPPLTYKNKRNNNVGGCDHFKGSICVIRW